VYEPCLFSLGVVVGLRVLDAGESLLDHPRVELLEYRRRNRFPPEGSRLESGCYFKTTVLMTILILILRAQGERGEGGVSSE